MCTNPSTLEKSCEFNDPIAREGRQILTPFLCCSERSCLSLLLILESLGILVILRLIFLGSLDSVEIAHRRNPRVHERHTLRGFSFPPCLPDMVVVDADVQNLCDPRSCRNARDRSHVQNRCAWNLPSSPCLKTTGNRFHWTRVISGMKGAEKYV